MVSVFLIVVVLLGVFFSMGYIVGRNSSGAPGPEVAAASRSSSSQPIVVDNPTRASQPGSGASSPASTTAQPPPSLPADEHPAKSKPAQVPIAEKPRPMEPKAESKPIESKPEPRREPPPESTPTRPSTDGPQPGQNYLQVVATTRADADLIAETLAKKGFHTTVAPGPNPTLFRVLVGPLRDAADMAETRVRLENTGFKNPYMRRY